MHLTTLALAATASLASLAHAASSAIIVNHCNTTIYLWSVGSTVGPQVTIAPNASYTEPFRVDRGSGGIALKITRVKYGLYTGEPQTILAYSLQGDQIWYGPSDIFGDPFHGSRVELVPSDGSCGSITWEHGVPSGGSEVRACQSGTDLTLTTC
ncbi:hypothetical protein VTN02DRAFT_5264 [Thermoascus thermophilus]